VLPQLFNRYGLQLNPDKICVTVFRLKEQSSIDFLGARSSRACCP
jgi:hypothetical protein